MGSLSWCGREAASRRQNERWKFSSEQELGLVFAWSVLEARESLRAIVSSWKLIVGLMRNMPVGMSVTALVQEGPLVVCRSQARAQSATLFP